MSDHATVYLAAGLTLALIVGVYGEKLAQAYRDIWSAKGRLRGAITVMRSARLVFLLIAVAVFAVAWPWLHGHG